MDPPAIGAVYEFLVSTPGQMAAVNVQGTGSLRLRYPLTLADARAAIQLGSHLNEDALFAYEMEWHVTTDHANEAGLTP